MEDYFEYQGSLLIPLTNDQKMTPKLGRQVLETKTLFEIVRGEVDNSALNIAPVQQKVVSSKNGQLTFLFDDEHNRQVSFELSDFLSSQVINGQLALAGFSLLAGNGDLRVSVEEVSGYGNATEIFESHLFQVDRQEKSGWPISFFVRPGFSYLITVLADQDIDKVHMSPVRYKAQSLSSNNNLPPFLHQKLLVECEGRIETIIPASSPIQLAEKVPFEIIIHEGGKKVKALDFDDIGLGPCELKITDTALSVITDAADITISIDNIPVELPASKQISLRSLNDEKLHTCAVFSKHKAARLANIDVRFPRYYTPVDVLSENNVNEKQEIFTRKDNYLSFIAGSDIDRSKIELANFLNQQTSVEEFCRSKTKFEIETKGANTTIIIPVYNQLEVTLRCLATLAAAQSENKFKVTIVDDHSPDDLSAIKTKFPNVHVIKNKKNEGFIGSINAGLASVKTEYALLLNNDTEVTSGFIDELIAVFVNFENVGLVGSKLLFSDGSLQEAGCVIWQGGVPWNYGRGHNPFDSRYRYTREVDYCSGASLFSKTDILNEVGGLSEYLKPAYFDDADLAMKVRSTGRKVYYAAKSKVFHMEGVSNGTSTESGIKSFQKINAQKFAEKWSDSFRFRQKPSMGQFNQIAEANYQKKALFIDYETPRSDKDAGGYAAINEMKMFQALGYKIDFLPENLAYFGTATHSLERLGVRCINHPEVFSVKEYLQRHIEEYDLVFVTRFNVAEPYLDILKSSKTPFYFNNADLHFLREYRRLAQGEQSDLVQDIRKRELAVIEAADVAFCYTEAERQIIESHILQRGKVKIMPWVAEAKVDKPIAKPGGKFCFLGSQHHKPNQDAVEFIKSVLAEECRDLEFIVGGYGWEKEKVGNFENVGKIEDLEGFFSQCQALIVPLASGAGIKGKIFEALSCGLPVISTEIGAEGIPVGSNKLGEVVALLGFGKSLIRFNTTSQKNIDGFKKYATNALNYIKNTQSLKAGCSTLTQQIVKDSS